MKTVLSALLLGLLAGVLPAQYLQARFDTVSATPLYPNGVPFGFGNEVVAIGDMTGDGISEYAVADSGFSGDAVTPNLSVMGAVHIFNGAGVPATLIASYYGQNPADFFGIDLIALDDMDGDGINEIAASGVGFGTTSGNGYVDVISPGAGTLFLRLTSPVPGFIYGMGLLAVNDQTGDGRRDLIVSEVGYACLYGTDTGTLLSRQPISSSFYNFPESHAMVAFDANGDGIDDFISGDPWADTVVLYNGASGSFGTVLATITGASGSQFGADVEYLGNNRVAIGAPGSDTIEIWNVTSAAQQLITTINGTSGSNLGLSIANLVQPSGSNQVFAAFSALSPAQARAYDQNGVAGVNIIQPGHKRVFSPGDVNGNGYGEIIVSPLGVAGSAVYVYPGGPVATVTSRGTGAAPAGLFGAVLFSPPSAGRPIYGNSGFGFSYAVNQYGAPAAFFAGNPLPQTLVFAPNYYAYVDLNTAASVSFVTTIGGFLPLPIPANPGLAGVTITAQVIVAGGAGWEFTQGVDLTIGL